MTLVKTDLGFLRIIQKFKIVGRETNNNKGHALNDIDNDALKFIRDEMTLKGVSANDFKVVVY
jgi:hypothetical protein